MMLLYSVHHIDCIKMDDKKRQHKYFPPRTVDHGPPHLVLLVASICCTSMVVNGGTDRLWLG